MAGKKKAEEGAPAYMSQFTALMTILLAFFITMQTMGMNRVSKYKKEGTGFIRDAFGAKGGMGVLAFMKSIMKKYPEVRKSDDGEDAEFLGYEKGVFESEVLDAEGIFKTEILDMGYDVRITLPGIFERKGIEMKPGADRALGRLGGVLYGLTNHIITVCCCEAAGSGDNGKIQAARKAYIVTKYFEQRAGIPRARMSAAGFEDTRYLGDATRETETETVWMVIRKKNNFSSGSSF